MSINKTSPTVCDAYSDRPFWLLNGRMHRHGTAKCSCLVWIAKLSGEGLEELAREPLADKTPLLPRSTTQRLLRHAV